MAFDIGAITGALVLDKSKWDTAIEKAKADSKSFEGAILRNDSRLKTLGVTMGLVGAGITAMNVKLLQLAAGVQLTETLFRASFGKMSDTALNWSRTLSKQFQLNTSDIQKSLASMNNLAKGLNISEDAAYEMSKSLTVLSVEMSRFFGISQEEAAMRLQMGMAGMTRGLREYGIILKETEVNQYALTHGIIKQGESLSESQAALARYALLMEKTKFLQGTMGESSRNLAGIWMKFKDQVNELAETLGASLVPAASAFLRFATNLVMAIHNLVQAFPQLTGALMMGVAAFGLLATAAGAVLLALPGLAAMSTAMGTTMAAAAGGLAVALLQTAAAIAAVVYAVQKFDLIKAVFFSFAEGVQYSLSRAALALANFVDKFTKIPGVGDALKDQRDSLLRIANDFNENSLMMQNAAVESLQTQMAKEEDFRLKISADIGDIGGQFNSMWQGAAEAAKNATDKMTKAEKSWYQKMIEDFNVFEEMGKRTFNMLADTISTTFYDLTFKLNDLQGVIENFGRNVVKVLFDIAAQMAAMGIIKAFGNMFGAGAGVANAAGAGTSTLSIPRVTMGTSLPSFDTGTSYVPYDMIAKVHKGEEILRPEQARGGQAIEVTIQNAIVPETVAAAMQSREGQRAIVNVIRLDASRNGVTRKDTIRS